MPDTPNTSPLPQDSEVFGKVRNTSESFGNLPHPSERFGNLPKNSERTDNHTLTVREVARMFEVAGVARTERSIVNWCQPNRQGMARLDAYFDTNDRRWFISSESVKLAIREELAKMSKGGEPAHSESVPNDAETATREELPTEESKALRQEIMDLKITNRAKDMFIEQIQKEREGMIERLVTGSQRIGELETRLRDLPQFTKQTELPSTKINP
jgi:hypothetical protein